MTKNAVFLIVNKETAWPISDRRLADMYESGLYVWPECDTVKNLSDEWTLTTTGSLQKKPEQGND